MLKCQLLLFALVAGAGASSATALADEARFIIVNPGGRGNQSKAGSFLRDFEEALAASWDPSAPAPPRWTGHYHVTVPDALASIRGQHPIFGLVSAGFPERFAEELGLVVIAVPDRGGPRVVRLVARADDETTRASVAAGNLAGIRFGGQVAAEPDWTRTRILAPIGATGSAVLVPHERDLAAIRGLRSGDIDVALLDDVDWRRLAELGRADGLAVIASSDVLPEGPVVAFTSLADEPAEEERRAGLAAGAASALQRMGTTDAGRKVLERMTLAGFSGPEAFDYDGDRASAAAETR